MSNFERITLIQGFLERHPRERSQVFSQTMKHLEKGELALARNKLRIDADKFLDKKLVTDFLVTIDLW